MAGWRDVARSVREQEGWDNRDDRDKLPCSEPIGAIVPKVPANPARTFREWSAALARLDLKSPMHGLPVGRWGVLVEDADWLLEHFGPQAAADGWSAADLFSVLPGRDGWGGIADRLRGSRSLVMSADRAAWRHVANGEPETYARGMGDLVKQVPLWSAEARSFTRQQVTPG